jgi:hypothetical protein
MKANATLATVSLLAGALLAWHYPLGQVWAVSGLLLAAGIAASTPQAWLVLVPALLPLIGLAPWTGWITFEEFDMLVLAVAAGGYGRAARDPHMREDDGSHSGMNGGALSVVWWFLVVLFAASVLTAMVRGFNDAGGFGFGWYQGYHEPMNSVRLAKSFFLALLLLPLWQRAQRHQPDQIAQALSLGLMLGLAGASLATVWERMAFTDLLNFSADYRTTGLFWEMHVGGAALDGFLALTTPFAVRELLQARTPARWGLAAAVCGLAGYACLTTFSRGVYLAVPVGLFVFYVLHSLQRRRLVKSTVSVSAVATAPYQANTLAGPLLVVGFAVGAGLMFQTSGYRGAVALLGVVALALPIAGLLRRLKPGQWIAGGIGGLILGSVAVVIAWFVPKGAYIAYVLYFCVTALTYLAHLRKAISTHAAGALAFGGLLATLASVVLVANNWGYAKATVPASAAASACLVLLLAAGLVRRPLWPESIRWQTGVLGAMGMAVAIVAVFGGGDYMGSRLTTGGRDMDDRMVHWKLGADMLQTPADWWFGKGEGRFVANYFLQGNLTQHPGDYRMLDEPGNTFLKLTGGLHVIGWGEYLRVSQRIAAPMGPLKVSLKVRTTMPVGLHFEVCEKHLLYNAHCLGGGADIKAAPGQWQTIETSMSGDAVSRGMWYTPKFLMFSVAMATGGGIADLDQIQLIGPDGYNLLANGDFANGMAHWFFSSDRHHLPWHIKSMFMHVLFDQGIVGLALWSLLVGGAVVRLAIGKAKGHSLAPALAAGLAGFAVVGLFDSLLDVPRVATLFYLLTLVALTLKPKNSIKSVIPAKAGIQRTQTGST